MKAPRATTSLVTAAALAISTLAGCGKDGRTSPESSNSTGHSGEGGAGADGSGGDGSGNVDSGDATANSATGGSDGGTSSGGTGGASSGGASSSGGSGGSASVDLRRYCNEVADRYFDWLANCYGTRAYPESYRPTFTNDHRERCMAVEHGVEAGRLGYDGVAAQACLDALDTETCDGFRFMNDVPECSALFTPLVDEGGDCYPDATVYFSVTGAPTECLDGYCDTANRQVCPGTCEPRKSNGAACVSTAECQPDSYCDGTECQSRVDLDAPCSYGDACRPDLVCSWLPAEEIGICKRPSEPGDACSDSEPCVGGYFCAAGECQSKVETGEECLQHHQCWNDELCIDRDADGPDPRTCGEVGAEGAACGSSLECQEALFCDTSAGQPGLCTPKLPLGQECVADDSCVATAYCNHELGECQEVGQQGDSCLMFDMPWQDWACAEDLACMSNGECHPVLGEAGEACRSTNEDSCNPGLFCSRETFLCEPLGAEGDFCNPYWSTSCEGDLACVCVGDECEYGADANVHDTLHTCQPRRSIGEPCFHAYECPLDAYCQDDEGERTCVASSMCLSEPG